MKKIWIISFLFLSFTYCFSFEVVALKENETKIYKLSVSEIPKNVYDVIIDFINTNNTLNPNIDELSTSFIIKHTFLFDLKNISSTTPEFIKNNILYMTDFKGVNIFTLYKKNDNKAFILNKNLNNEQLTYLINNTFSKGFANILKSGDLEYFYKAIFDLTYGIAGETGIFLEAWIKDIDDVSGNGRMISLISIKKNDLLKMISPSIFMIIGNMDSWEGKFCVALKDGEIIECTVKGNFFDGDKLKIKSITDRVILKNGKFKLLYVP